MRFLVGECAREHNFEYFAYSFKRGRIIILLAGDEVVMLRRDGLVRLEGDEGHVVRLLVDRDERVLDRRLDRHIARLDSLQRYKVVCTRSDADAEFV